MTMTIPDLQRAYPFEEHGPFRSHNELTAALSSPLYKADPDYRTRVEIKLAMTDRSAWNLSDPRAPIRFTHAPEVVPSDEGFGW